MATLTTMAGSRHGGKAQNVRAGRGLVSGRFDSRLDYHVQRPYGSDDWLLFATEAGAGLFRHADGELRSQAGDLILLAPHHPHDYRICQQSRRWRFTWVHFLPQTDWAPLMVWPNLGPGIAGLTISDQTSFAAILDHLHAMHQYTQEARHHRDALAMNALATALLLVDEHHPQSPAVRDGQRDPRLRMVIERVSRDLAHPWDVEAMAAIADWSPSRFAHRFRQDFGETPRRFVERLRLERAQQLLRATALSIQDIAAQVGFPDPFHFSNRYRTCVGHPPSHERPQEPG